MSPEKLFYFSLGSQPLKNRTRGFFFGASNCKNLSGKSSFEREPGGATVVEPKSREQVGETLDICGFDASEKFPLKSFFYMISELFYCIKNPEKQSSQVSQVSQEEQS